MPGSGRGFFVSICAAAGAVIYGVHYQQEYDKVEMHKGVLKDVERRRAKALESKSQRSHQGDKETSQKIEKAK